MNKNLGFNKFITMNINNSFYTFDWYNLTLNILATPWAKQDKIWKIVWDRLKVSIKKQPENWEATEYLRKFLAWNFWVSLKNVVLIYWETSRDKAFKITNPLIIPEKLKNIINI